MALDEALIEVASTAGKADPILRFYEWARPAVTLGRFQDAAASVDLGGCRRAGIEVVRRPTGGRAVYHDTDLTFSLIFPETALGGRSVRETHRSLMAAIGQGLARLDLEVRAGVHDAPGPRSHTDCFAHSAPSDLTLRAQKILGSAQMRRAGWIMQQGSIRLWPISVPHGLFRDARLECQSSIDLNLLLTKNVVADAIQDSFGVFFECEWQAGPIHAGEGERAAQLESEKYRTDGWNLYAKAPQTGRAPVLAA